MLELMIILTYASMICCVNRLRTMCSGNATNHTMLDTCLYLSYSKQSLSVPHTCP
jgi:hypothetical protein